MIFCGRPIAIRFEPSLTASRGRLLSRSPAGRPVHAGTFVRKRLIVLDAELRRNAAERERILLHEVFHFVWVRLGNGLRHDWERLLAREMRSGVPGELGWSAELRKDALGAGDRRRRSRGWREYACESFCDTAAWLYREGRRHAEYTLPAGARRERRRWFRSRLNEDALPV